MATSESASSPLTPAAFADMDLRVGQKLLLAVDWPAPEKYYSQLIGYQEPEFIILKPPEANGATVQMAVGKALEVRLFSGVSVFTFKTRVQAFLMHPRNYMLMSFPEEVLESRLRAYNRVLCELPAQVHGVQGQTISCIVRDLSGGGALVTTPNTIGQVGDKVQLHLQFDLQATGTREQLSLNATIRNIVDHKEPNGQTVKRNGLEFDDTHSKIFLLVYELQQMGKKGH